MTNIQNAIIPKCCCCTPYRKQRFAQLKCWKNTESMHIFLVVRFDFLKIVRDLCILVSHVCICILNCVVYCMHIDLHWFSNRIKRKKRNKMVEKCAMHQLRSNKRHLSNIHFTSFSYIFSLNEYLWIGSPWIWLLFIFLYYSLPFLV